MLKLPLPPENLRVWVGPFADADLFRESGEETVRSIISLCGLKSNARVVDIGCGCGRVAAALAAYLSDKGRYDGFDVAAPLINWCRVELEPRLPQFHFCLADDVFAGGQNPAGHKDAAMFVFPYANDRFDLAILCSVLTHILPDAIENYTRRWRRTTPMTNKPTMPETKAVGLSISPNFPVKAGRGASAAATDAERR